MTVTRTVARVLGLLLLCGLAGPARAVDVGEHAPEFTLKDLAGKDASLSDFHGKVVFLDFWTSWCPYCVDALPHTQKLSEREEAKQGDLVVLAPNVGEDAEKIGAFINQCKYTLRALIDPDGTVSDRFGVDGIPQFMVIGRDGLVKWSFAGFDGEETVKAIDQAVDEALKAPAPAATP